MSTITKICINMAVIHNMPFQNRQLFLQSDSEILCTENRILFFAENCNLKVEAVPVQLVRLIS